MLTETLLRILFSVIGRCSLVPSAYLSLAAGKMLNNYLSQAASDMVCRLSAQVQKVPCLFIIVSIKKNIHLVTQSRIVYEIGIHAYKDMYGQG
jgi:hypothetical protein